MKISQLFSAVLLMGAVVLAACDGPVVPPPPVQGDTLTVADAITKQDGKIGIVEGYIVGWYNNHTNARTVEFGAEATADTTVNAANIVIADKADETDATKTICVQIQGTIRNNVNLKDHPEHLGQAVVVKGVLKDYNSMAGIKNTEALFLNGKDMSQIDLTNVKTITIAEAIEICNGLEDGAKTKENYLIQGTITRITASTNQGNEVVGKAMLDLQDETGSIAGAFILNIDNKEFTSKDEYPNVGAVVKLVGPLSVYKGTPQLQNGYIAEIISNEAAKATEYGPITIAELLEKEDSPLVWYEVTGTMGEIKSDVYGNFDLTDETGTIYVYGLIANKPADLANPGKNDKSFSTLGLKAGDNITICGYKTTYGGTKELGLSYFVKKNN